MGRRKKIFEGFVFKKWVVVGEAEKQGAVRTLVCKCLACGEVKKIRADLISTGRAADCTCKRRVPYVLPSNKGTACISRERKCGKNGSGYCCYYCPKKRECAEACLNSPDKCGSFYIHIQPPEKTAAENAPEGLIKYRREVK